MTRPGLHHQYIHRNVKGNFYLEYHRVCEFSLSQGLVGVAGVVWVSDRKIEWRHTALPGGHHGREWWGDPPVHVLQDDLPFRCACQGDHHALCLVVHLVASEASPNSEILVESRAGPLVFHYLLLIVRLHPPPFHLPSKLQEVRSCQNYQPSRRWTPH